MEHVNCDLCGSSVYELYYRDLVNCQNKDKKFNIVKCKNCGLVYLNPRPDNNEINKYYHDDYYSFRQLDRKLKGFYPLFDRIKDKIREATFSYYYGSFDQSKTFWSRKIEQGLALIGRRRFISAPHNIRKGKILDVGCGDGLFIYPLKELGWQVYGLEINDEAAQRARARGLNVKTLDLLDSDFPDDFFDVVRMLSVLEHLHHPSKYLKKAYKILKPGGYLIIETPNIESLASKIFGKSWAGLDVPRHLYHFNDKTLKKIISNNGFQIKKLFFKSVGTIASSITQSKFSKFLIIITAPFDFITDLFKMGDCIVIFAQKENNI